MKAIPYREAVGSLMYLMVCTRPDIAVAVSEVSKFLSNPGRRHWSAVKRIIRYLIGTKNLKLVLGGQKSFRLTGFADADYARDTDSRKSRTGYLTQIGGSTITWKSKMQATTAGSTCEAEYYAINDLLKEIRYILPLCKEFGIEQELPITLNEDNQGTIAMSEKRLNNTRSKHIDVRYHIIREFIENGTIYIRYCPTEKQLADILTKPLSPGNHARLTDLLGLKRTFVEDNTVTEHTFSPLGFLPVLSRATDNKRSTRPGGSVKIDDEVCQSIGKRSRLSLDESGKMTSEFFHMKSKSRR
jgi:hypothetical protein